MVAVLTGLRNSVRSKRLILRGADTVGEGGERSSGNLLPLDEFNDEMGVTKCDEEDSETGDEKLGDETTLDVLTTVVSGKQPILRGEVRL